MKDPVEEGEQAAEIALECSERRLELGEILDSSRLLLNVRVN
jgi:hypothetical protein